MPRRPLPDHDIAHLRRLYVELGSTNIVARQVGLNNKTVRKYVRDLIPRKTVDNTRVVMSYRATGSLDRTGACVGLSRVSVWRRLKKMGVQVGKGATDWKRLYATMRGRCTRGTWRASILERDNHTCVRCGEPSNTVHHVTRRLADIRDDVLREHPEVDPFRSRQDLSGFLDLVDAAHENVEGEVLCYVCHEDEHSSGTTSPE